MPNGQTNLLHFLKGEPVASGEITGCTARGHIPLYVRLGVVDPVKAAWEVSRSTVDARLNDKGKDFSRGHVALVNSAVRFPKGNGTSFVALTIPQVTGFRLVSLIRRHAGPSVGSIVAPPFSFAMAGAAFISQAIAPCLINNKILGSCREFAITTIAAFVTRLRGGPIFCAHR